MFQTGGCLKRKNVKDKSQTPFTKVTLVENSDCRDLKDFCAPAQGYADMMQANTEVTHLCICNTDVCHNPLDKYLHCKMSHFPRIKI